MNKIVSFLTISSAQTLFPPWILLSIFVHLTT
ncbi:UNVERIFIED_CONTAM: hypothetical protein NCL1_41781 [Trichonephila clavipes]